MAQAKEKKKETALQKCVCGSEPVMVTHRGRKMVCCPNAIFCAVRGGWYGEKESAIKSWNTAVEEARHRKKKAAKQGG